MIIITFFDFSFAFHRSNFIFLISEIIFIEIPQTWAIEFLPDPGPTDVDTPGHEISPFGKAVVLSLGYVVTLVVTVPLGLFNLDDNIIVQTSKLIHSIILHTSTCSFCKRANVDIRGVVY